MLEPGALPLVLRRHENEQLEITAVRSERGSSSPASLPPCQIWSCDEGETRIYTVSNWTDYAVTPVDWRRFAYEHGQVKDLLTRCVRDNWTVYIGAALNDSLLNGLRSHLTVALGDLSTLFDVHDVACERGDGDALTVTVTGEHKNGKQEMYTIGL
jgi:hypothetical protein